MKRSFLLLGIIVVAVLAFFPTPHTRISAETVTKNDLKKIYDCAGSLQDGYSWQFTGSNFPSSLKFVVNVTSTEDLAITIKTVAGTVSENTLKVHSYTSISIGPSLDVKVNNPSLFGLGPIAVTSGDIRVYHTYDEPIEYTEWLPWWMP